MYSVLNFAYGNGPYVMTTKLAVAFNDELARLGKERLKIIIPWVYGEKQKKIMAEEGLLTDEIILDEKLGAILKKVFYENENFEDYLKKWTGNFKEASREANAYLTTAYGNSIVIELNRSPRLLYGVAPAYSTSFGRMSRVFKESGKGKAAAVAECVEREQEITAFGYPGIFPKEGDLLIPPIAPMPAPNTEKINKGIFITKSGIAGLDRLYSEAEKLGLKVYTNSEYSPALITNENILIHFARAGWASIWFSILAEKPLVAPEYDPADDVEIKFNNEVIEKLGVGVVYRGEPLSELSQKTEKAKEACRKIKKEILDKWGNLDGTRYCAKLFAEKFLKER